MAWWVPLAIAAGAGAGGLGLGAWGNGKNSGKQDYNINNYTSTALGLSGDDAAVWDSLSEAQKRAIITKYYTEDNSWKNLWGMLGPDRETVDNERLLADLQELSEMQAGLKDLPEAPDYADSLKYAQGEVDAALGELESLRAMQVNNFNDELSSLANSYNTSRNAILSSQYQQNAQLMDNMTSQLDKQNRNALEAGASAGMRLAGNINTLLSTQNKQSQTSLETANQLAQMMVNQRNAEASVRGRYGDYMQQHFVDKQNIKDSLYGRADAHFNAEDKKYDSALGAWNDKWGHNATYEFKGALKDSNKPKYGT